MAALQANRTNKKRKTAPIYRELEKLLSWEADVFNRLPKSKGYQLLGEEAFRSTRESLVLSELAYKTPDTTAKKEILGALGVQILIITSSFRSLRELSKLPNHPRVLTEDQFKHFIEMISNISHQQQAWDESNSQRSDTPQGRPA